MISRSYASMLGLLLALVFGAGPAVAEETKKKSKKKKGGGETPAQVYELAANAFAAKRYKELATHFSPAARRELCSFLTLMANFMVDDALSEEEKKQAIQEVDALATKHGLDRHVKAQFKGEDGRKKFFAKYLANLKDEIGLLAGLVRWITTWSDKVELPIGKLMEVQLKGDFATGTHKTEVTPRGSKKKTVKDDRSYFRKVDGRWYLDESDEVKEAFRQKPR